MSAQKAELEGALARLREEGGTSNRLVVAQGAAWFALTAGVGDREARCFAATQKHLGRPLSPHGRVALRMADFAKAPGDRALSRSVSIATDPQRAQLAEQMLGWFGAVFGPSEAPVQVTLKLGERLTMANESLHQAIRVLARERSQRARQAVYRSLIKAQLQLLVTDQGEPAPFGELAGAHTYAVFTSATEADLMDPRGLPIQVLPGWAIFPRLFSLNPASLQINPGGRLGGELYRNEIEALARACEGYRR